MAFGVWKNMLLLMTLFRSSILMAYGADGYEKN